MTGILFHAKVYVIYSQMENISEKGDWGFSHKLTVHTLHKIYFN